MRHGSRNAQQEHRGEIGRQRTGGLAKGEGYRQPDEQRLARDLAGGKRQERTTDGDAAGVTGDEITGGRHGDAETLRHLRQHAGDDEFSRAESESGNEEGDKRQHGAKTEMNAGRQTTDGCCRQCRNCRHRFSFS